MSSPTPPLPVPFVGRKGHRVPNGPQMVTVWNIATGEELVVKPISAKEGVAAGVWSRTPPEPPAPVEAAGDAAPTSEAPPSPPAKAKRAKAQE